MLKKAFDNVQNREMKSENGFSLAMASQPFPFPMYFSKEYFCELYPGYKDVENCV